ncbi:MAG: hypothetical protein AUI99_01685 [Gemmatimonadetes bacterium 13_1_40CM_3_69_22]|nr:MAG: hypothetical protein AUI99_01685 [Gemmatimonadetes bacterium 13_1_40CM_3_69_22]OLD93014.1 MAG: hypothetical protein AUG79_13210 [Gemmatimonadetes bacterium 13_1_20CM_4_69_16]PYO14213.1 MAG: hypothetical protein DMD31_10460 [Gemmatimonadota bacterium]
MDQRCATDAAASRWARLMALFGLRGGSITRADVEERALEEIRSEPVRPEAPEERGGSADRSGTTT